MAIPGLQKLKRLSISYPSMVPIQGLPIDSTNGNDDTSSYFFQDLVIEIHGDKAFTSDVDLYFNTPVVDWRGGKDDPNWVLNWWQRHGLAGQV
jgi:hypothetical protein